VVSVVLLAPQRGPDPDANSSDCDMTELRNVEADLSRFRVRVLVASIVVLAFFLLLSRLVYLQMVRHDDLEEQAENNRTAMVPIVPNRGLILDRNGIVLATNYSAYTLEITPSRVALRWSRPSTTCQVMEISSATAAGSKSCWKNPKALNHCPSAPA
jgi:penicillin-binding protein 2